MFPQFVGNIFQFSIRHVRACLHVRVPVLACASTCLGACLGMWVHA